MNKTVDKTLKILDLIAKNPEGITLSSISKQLNIAKSTTFDILQTLYSEDAVYYKNEILKTYVIGSKLFAIGQTYTKNSNFIHASSTLLKEFAEKYGVTVFGCKRLVDKVTFVYKYESRQNKIITKDVGTQLSLFECIMGKTFIAFESALKDYQKETVLSNIIGRDKVKSYLEELKKIKEAGIAVDNGSYDSYIRWFAAPVHNFENRVAGCVACAMLITEDTEHLIPQMMKDLIQVAAKTSSSLGYKKLI